MTAGHPLTSRILYPATLKHRHSTPATVAYLPFFYYARYIPTSGPLHALLPLSGTFFPKIPTWSLSLSLDSNVTFLVQPSLIASFKATTFNLIAFHIPFPCFIFHLYITFNISYSLFTAVLFPLEYKLHEGRKLCSLVSPQCLEQSDIECLVNSC